MTAECSLCCKTHTWAATGYGLVKCDVCGVYAVQEEAR